MEQLPEINIENMSPTIKINTKEENEEQQKQSLLKLKLKNSE